MHTSASPLGLLGGSFDPVHNAHLALAHSALALLGLERVLWLPSGVPPHRAAPVAGAAARLEMLRLAIGSEALFAVDPRELARAAPSYTVDTLMSMRSELGDTRALVLLIGGDQFTRLATWHRWQELFALAHIAVFARPGWSLDADAPDELRKQFAGRRSAPGADWRVRGAGSIIDVPMAPLEISSTLVRERIARRDAPHDMVPPAVLEYVSANRLYR
ncbi:MAG: nicotinate-nucleotide adenylyltransferase [Betaproteobacteria bacterium]|nr:nicotinate-nucleotide adenylyltransferase [Betaproteobacteria bacterium]